MNRAVPKPFGLQDKIGYALGDLGCNLCFQLVASYMFLFYTQCIGLSTSDWAWIIIISKVWDAVNDIIIGRLVAKHGSQFCHIHSVAHPALRDIGFLVLGNDPVGDFLNIISG